MNTEKAPVLGVFDSGVGGLSVVRAIRRRLPGEALLYVADNANCPYGARPHEDIVRLSLAITRFLLAHGAKAIVVACNTASAAALASLRQEYPAIPFIGMVPAVKPAALTTRTGVVGVLATPGTFQGKLYEDVVSQYAVGVRILASACPGLVELVEDGEVEGQRTESFLQAIIDPMVEQGADTLVLGCTHYPFLIPAISRLYGDALQVLEPSDAVARQVEHVLTERGIAAQAEAVAPTQVYVSTGDTSPLQRALRHFLGYRGAVNSARWEENNLVLEVENASQG